MIVMDTLRQSQSLENRICTFQELYILNEKRFFNYVLISWKLYKIIAGYFMKIKCSPIIARRSWQKFKKSKQLFFIEHDFINVIKNLISLSKVIGI